MGGTLGNTATGAKVHRSHVGRPPEAGPGAGWASAEWRGPVQSPGPNRTASHHEVLTACGAELPAQHEPPGTAKGGPSAASHRPTPLEALRTAEAPHGHHGPGVCQPRAPSQQTATRWLPFDRPARCRSPHRMASEARGACERARLAPAVAPWPGPVPWPGRAVASVVPPSMPSAARAAARANAALLCPAPARLPVQPPRPAASPASCISRRHRARGPPARRSGVGLPSPPISSPSPVSRAASRQAPAQNLAKPLRSPPAFLVTLMTLNRTVLDSGRHCPTRTWSPGLSRKHGEQCAGRVLWRFSYLWYLGMKWR
mmetsp:Transcript_6903/g.23576  ORF Transcript_6903/g.23576 Transcript_6903/m.23576 type:complete len:315 (-) Transcript_6903:318-1262(-)